MCFPALGVAAAAWVPMAVSAVSTIASSALAIMGDMQKQRTNREFQQRQVQAREQQIKENRELATRAYLDQAIAANENLAETREAVAAENLETGKKKLEAQGEVLAAAAEGGVSGLSLSALLADFDRQEGVFFARNQQNLVFKQQQTARQKAGFFNQADARIKQIRPFIPGPLDPVDIAGPALSIVGKGASISSDFNRAKEKALAGIK